MSDETYEERRRRVLDFARARAALREVRGVETLESVESARNRAALSLEHEMGFREIRGTGDSREMTMRKWLTEEAGV
jgi:hypothetical protein